MDTVRGPDDTKRTIILGRTGSGKTVFGLGLLAVQNWTEIPWIIFDFKGDPLLIEILKSCKGYIKEIKPEDKPPNRPGLYYMKPRPVVDDDALTAFLWACWKKGNIGIYLDEGYCIDANSKPFNVILTQGRAIHVPVIALYQRPVYMSRFAVAQADFFACFEQNDERDLKTTKSFIKAAKGENGETVTVFTELPPYYCLWYDVGRGTTTVLSPAPEPKAVVKTFKSRLVPAKQRALI